MNFFKEKWLKFKATAICANKLAKKIVLKEEDNKEERIYFPDEVYEKWKRKQ